jgi:DNA polymerase-1
MREPLILVDVSNVGFRTHYAAPQLKSSSGKPTSVLHGVLRIIADLRRTVSKRIIFCWDHGVPVAGAKKPKNWRDDLLPGYKANRTSNAEERARCLGQFADLNRAIRLLGYESASVMGLEADDVIGILVSGPGNKLIYSTDKDFYQLLDGDRVKILVPQKGKSVFQTLSAASVEKEHGFPINRWAEYLALGGDKSDNIKPMRGMGPKTAEKLIHGGISLITELEDQPPWIQKKYGEAWPAIRLSWFAARLPRKWSDPRVRECVAKVDVNGWRLDGAQRWKDRAASAAAFGQFCADRDLTHILSLRHQLFET